MFIINLVNPRISGFIEKEFSGKDRENVCIEGRRITLRYTLLVIHCQSKATDLLRTVHIFQRTYYSKRFIVEFMQNSPRRWQFKISNLFTYLQLLNGSVKDSGNGSPPRFPRGWISFIKTKARCKSDRNPGSLKTESAIFNETFSLVQIERNREKNRWPMFGLICIKRFGKYLMVNRAVFHWSVKYVRLQNILTSEIIALWQ